MVDRFFFMSSRLPFWNCDEEMKTVPKCCYIRRKLSRIVPILIGRVLKFHRGSCATWIIHAQLSLLANIGKRKAFVDQLKK